ncbi:MAG: EMC3/TMCO1 family protein, partial [Candidatus Thalassarchaeaceae archaeon]|nr:EMC3/TMCO1 family protein [Candidatus Thalassarchaeaceae archaeon]
QYFVPTVSVVGSSIMVVNTIIRSFFVDSLKQAHNAHRGKQIGKQLREARAERDTSRMNKMQELQLALGPENMATQAEMFRPMMFTIVFIIAIFSWMSASIETFRVSYVSLPWAPTWSFSERIFWIIPAWIASYITMSAPLGRIVDRHIKIIRYRRHPLVLAAEPIPEPLLFMLDEPKRKSSSSASRTRQSQRRRSGPRKTGMKKDDADKIRGGNTQVAPPKKGSTCPSCDSDSITRTSYGKLRCDVCRNEWR